jgi:hypothetical protein
MLHGTTPDAAALADSAVILSVIRGLIAKRVIDHIDARLWMDNAISMIQEDKNVTRKKAEAIAIIKNEFVLLIG